MAKTVLVCYGERKKKISISSGDDALSGLKEECYKRFDIDSSKEITLQQFDHEWNEFVDVEEDDEIVNKAMLKVVISKPVNMSDDVEIPKSADESIFSELEHNTDPITSSPIQNQQPDVHEIIETEATEKIVSKGSASKEFLLVTKIIKKTTEESTPLPDPFPLPTNFRPDVHIALTSKKMTKTTRAAFFSSIAAAMFQYKRYPSRDDYVSIARQIVSKYPFLGSVAFGASYEGIVQTLIDRFKDMRRTRKPRPVSTKREQAEDLSKPLKKPKLKEHALLPNIPEGGDEVSFQRHNKILSLEWKKASRNEMIVEELMSRTFAQRRKQIIENSNEVCKLFDEFPFLQEPNQLLNELERITNIDVKKAGQEWKSKWAPKIIKQAQLEAKARPAIKNTFDELTLLDWDDSLVALVLLVYLVPDSRSKADHSKIVYHIPDSSPVPEAIKKKKQQSPYILMTGLPLIQAFLVVDKCVVCECEINDIVLLLLSAFFSFNICYTPGCCNFYSFLDCVVLGRKVKLPASVKHLLASLDS